MCYNLIWWFLGVYRVHGTIKEKFVTNVVHVEVQRRHLYIVHHATRVAKVIATYQTKHDVIDMVLRFPLCGFHFLDYSFFEL